jgi:hypothetical protein
LPVEANAGAVDYDYETKVKIPIDSDLYDFDYYEQDSLVRLQEEGCYDSNGTDRYGDGCDWYSSNEFACGMYDTEDFEAGLECCGCGGGSPTEDYDFTYSSSSSYSYSYSSSGYYSYSYSPSDYYSYSYSPSSYYYSYSYSPYDSYYSYSSYSPSSYYYSYSYSPSSYYSYSDYSYSSYSYYSYSSSGSYSYSYSPSSDYYESTTSCFDILDSVDRYGDGCDWYSANPFGCGTFDSEDFTAAINCCACGGGISASEDYARDNDDEDFGSFYDSMMCDRNTRIHEVKNVQLSLTDCA